MLAVYARTSTEATTRLLAYLNNLDAHHGTAETMVEAPEQRELERGEMIDNQHVRRKR